MICDGLLRVHHSGFCGACPHPESKSDPTHETVTFFLYNSIKTATYSLISLLRVVPNLLNTLPIPYQSC